MAYSFYDSYRAIQLSPSEKIRDDLQQVVNKGFENASDYFVIKKKNRTNGKWENIGVRLTFPYKIKEQSTIKDDYRTILFKDPNITLNMGDLYSFNNYYYLCVDVGKQESPTASCLVQRCNVELKWTTSSTPVMPSTPLPIITVYGVATQKIVDPSEDKFILLPNNTLMVTIPNEADGRLIKDSPKGTRFIIGDKAWKVVAVDNISGIRTTYGSTTPTSDNGVIKLRIQSEQINSQRDNVASGIAQQL